MSRLQPDRPWVLYTKGPIDRESDRPRVLINRGSDKTDDYNLHLKRTRFDLSDIGAYGTLGLSDPFQ